MERADLYERALKEIIALPVPRAVEAIEIADVALTVAAYKDADLSFRVVWSDPDSTEFKTADFVSRESALASAQRLRKEGSPDARALEGSEERGYRTFWPAPL